MTFQAYIDNIEKKTGKRPEDFRALARTGGLLRADLTATEFVGWVQREFGLGHGHAMALWAVCKREQWLPAGPAAARPHGRGARP